MLGGCLPSLLPLPILLLYIMYLWVLQQQFHQEYHFYGLKIYLQQDQYHILPVLAALSTYIPSFLMTKSMPKNDGSYEYGIYEHNDGRYDGIYGVGFLPILVIYWIIGGVIQLVQTYFVNYLPYKKKLDLKTEEEALVVSEKVKKATPKTRKR